MSRIVRATQCLATATVLVWSASAIAGEDPKGIWFDHNGRGAVEIKDCQKGPGLCGFVVHVKEKKHEDRCGTQILGNVTPSGGGWIYSPSRGKKYTVRISRLNSSKLRVVGNASSSFFSKTFTWKKAPDDIELCGKYANAQRETIASKSEKTQPRKQRDVVRRDEPAIVDEQRRETKKFSSVAAEEEADLRRSSKDRVVPDEVDRNGEATPETAEENGRYGEKTYGDISEEEADPNEQPVENEVSEVIDKLIDRANEYTGKLERKCRFRIPYVDKVIMIPCRD